MSHLISESGGGGGSYASFKELRLESNPPETKFHYPLKTNRPKTFSRLSKVKEVKCSSRVVILQTDRSLFGRIIVIAKAQSLQMDETLSHPLGPLP